MGARPDAPVDSRTAVALDTRRMTVGAPPGIVAFWVAAEALEASAIRPRTSLRSSCNTGVQCLHQRMGILLQNLPVDVFDGVTGPMVAGIVGATCRPAEHGGLG